MKALTATYVIALVILQLVFGNLEPKMFAFPINFALLASLIAVCAVVEREYGKQQWVKALRSTDLSVILLCLIAVGAWRAVACRRPMQFPLGGSTARG